MFQSVFCAIESWLEDDVIYRVQDIEKRLERRLLQIKYEGYLTPELEKIARIWTTLLRSLCEDKEDTLSCILTLFNYGQISQDFASRVILKLFNEEKRL